MTFPIDLTRTNTRKRLFLASAVAVSLAYWPRLSELLALAYRNEHYTHVFLIVPLSILLSWVAIREQPLHPGYAPFAGGALIFVAIAAFLASSLLRAEASNAAFALSIAALVTCWIGLFAFFYGAEAVRRLLFPLVFLFLIVPIPEAALDKCIVALQAASTHFTYLLFRWTGVPVLKQGFVLALPSFEIEIAQQCSGIRSAIMLGLSSLVLGYLYLRSYWARMLLVIAAVPLAVAKNAIRIYALSMLGMHVDASFLTGQLHHDGGVVFFVIALAAMVGLLKALQRTEAVGLAPERRGMTKSLVAAGGRSSMARPFRTTHPAP